MVKDPSFGKDEVAELRSDAVEGSLRPLSDSSDAEPPETVWLRLMIRRGEG